MVGETRLVGGGLVHLVVGHGGGERRGRELVVDAPSGVVGESLSAPAPPGVRAVDFARPLADCARGPRLALSDFAVSTT